MKQIHILEEGFADRKRVEITKIPVCDRVPGFKQVEECLCDEDVKKRSREMFKVSATTSN